MMDRRTCGHGGLWGRSCDQCLRERQRRAVAASQAAQREAATQQASEPGGPTLRELRAANQERLARERGL